MEKLWQFKYTFAVTILVLVGMFMPGGNVPSVGIPHIDKVVHFGMFFCIVASYYFEFIKVNGKHPKWWMVLGALLILAITTELVQGMTDSRSCDVVDGIADMIGTITSIGVCTVVGNWWFSKQS